MLTFAFPQCFYDKGKQQRGEGASLSSFAPTGNLENLQPLYITIGAEY